MLPVVVRRPKLPSCTALRSGQPRREHRVSDKAPPSRGGRGRAPIPNAPTGFKTLTPRRRSKPAARAAASCRPFGVLQTPQIIVGVQHEPLTVLWQIFVRDLTTHPLVGRPPAMQAATSRR